MSKICENDIFYTQTIGRTVNTTIRCKPIFFFFFFVSTNKNMQMRINVFLTYHTYIIFVVSTVNMHNDNLIKLYILRKTINNNIPYRISPRTML